MQSATPENLILLCGELTSGGEKIHALDGMNAREFTIKVVLPSGTDLLPVLIPEALIDDTVAIGATVSVTGKLISEEQTENGETPEQPQQPETPETPEDGEHDSGELPWL